MIPEGLWTKAGEFLLLPPPDVEDVEWVLRRVVKKLAKAFAEVDEAWPENGLDWATLQRRTFEADVWQCPCGGRRQVVAVVSTRRTAEEVLRNLGRLPPKPVPRRGQSPPRLALAL